MLLGQSIARKSREVMRRWREGVRVRASLRCGEEVRGACVSVGKGVTGVKAEVRRVEGKRGGKGEGGRREVVRSNS
jgi:hypothetical protein